MPQPSRILSFVIFFAVALLLLSSRAVAQTIYVTSQASQTITAIQGSTITPVATISTSPYVPGPIAVTPDGRWAYVANICGTTDPGSVTVADLVNNKVASVTTVGRCPDAIAVTQNGTAVYVSNGPDDSVSVTVQKPARGYQPATVRFF